MFDLMYWDGDIFMFMLLIENVLFGLIFKVIFVGDMLNLEYYDVDKLGMFI